MGSSGNATPPICPLCKQPPEILRRATDGSVTLQVSCERCGRFSISDQALADLTSENRYLLSAASRLWTGERRPLILTTNIRELVEQVPKFTVSDQLDALLQLVADRSPELGSASTFDSNRDYPLLVARNVGEATYFANGLAKRGFINTIGSRLAVTLEGWERLSAI